jgi:plasmid stabilization system protein ParE
LVYVIWTDPALDDLRAIKDYIAKSDPAAAQRFCTALYDSTDRLRLFPKSGQVVPEFGREDVREIIFRDYRILYKCVPGACYVAVVVHGSSDLHRPIDPSHWD